MAEVSRPVPALDVPHRDSGGVSVPQKKRRWPDHLRDEHALDDIVAPNIPPDSNAVEDLLNTEVLTPASRAVLLLHFREEMTLQEVAAVLELPIGTVKSRLAYGLAALRRERSDRRM